jgi:hypothetical protein
MSVALVHLIPTLMERQLGECIEHNGQVFGLTRAGNGTIKIETKTARVIVLARGSCFDFLRRLRKRACVGIPTQARCSSFSPVKSG